jgi:anhydro-N-acetylmuramic acid kinase
MTDGGLRPEAYVGLMSGTSLDGISAVVARFHTRGDTFEPELLAFTAQAYDATQRDRLLRAMARGSAQEYSRIAFDLGGWLADAAASVIAEAGVPRSEIRAIGSHGQTLWHEPPHSSWQIGEAAVIAERTRVDVVSDFRVADVAAGGQGAPLVPIADASLFATSTWRGLQNIGGIANVTIVPPGGASAGVRAFDTGPGVAIIDAVVRAVDPTRLYDEGGRLAASGTPIADVVSALLDDPYFASPPPKSTGREHFGSDYARRLLERCREARADAAIADIVSTATSLTARSIGDAYRRFMPEPVTEVLVSGGGANNATLVRMIQDAVAPIAVRPFRDAYFDGEAKEAVAFAFLAKLFVERRPGNVPRATGARGPRILGKLTPAAERA